MHEDLRHDGRGNAYGVEVCPLCSDSAREVAEVERSPVFRCEECMGGLMECRDCCLTRHARLPLHRIEVSFFSTGVEFMIWKTNVCL